MVGCRSVGFYIGREGSGSFQRTGKIGGEFRVFFKGPWGLGEVVRLGGGVGGLLLLIQLGGGRGTFSGGGGRYFGGSRGSVV